MPVNPKAGSPDRTQPYDPNRLCPACNDVVHMYMPPERMVAGSAAYPCLLLHYEVKHPNATPPPPPVGDEWNPPPPAPEDWRPVDRGRAERQLPQPDGVWPPVLMPERPL